VASGNLTFNKVSFLHITMWFK